MKSITFYISFFCLAGGLLASCDTIENPYPKSFPQLSAAEVLALDELEADTDSINGSVAPVQKVLLEDYTGHQCGNCPSAAMKAREQKAIWGERLVVMAVHAGYFAKTLSNDTVVNPSGKYIADFSTPTSEDWNTIFAVAAYPAGMINRAPKTGSASPVQGISTWPAAIAAQLAETPQIGMTLTTIYDKTTRKLNVKVRSKYLANQTGKYNLMVVITEDGIINWQKNYGAAAGGDPSYATPDEKNYVHPHALRLALTDSWGKPNKENPKAGNVTEEYVTATLDNAWKAEKCSVIAFIMDEATREVIQVEEMHLEE